jgi:hypothetical protein
VGLGEEPRKQPREEEPVNWVLDGGHFQSDCQKAGTPYRQKGIAMLQRQSGEDQLTNL